MSPPILVSNMYPSPNVKLIPTPLLGINVFCQISWGCLSKHLVITLGNVHKVITRSAKIQMTEFLTVLDVIYVHELLTGHGRILLCTQRELVVLHCGGHV